MQYLDWGSNFAVLRQPENSRHRSVSGVAENFTLAGIYVSAHRVRFKGLLPRLFYQPG